MDPIRIPYFMFFIVPRNLEKVSYTLSYLIFNHLTLLWGYKETEAERGEMSH